MTIEGPGIMSEPSKIRIWLPVSVPMAVNFIGSAWILVTARRARYAGACGIGLPWDREMSYTILKRLFPAALEEAETFRMRISQCIADLHADITSAYTIILMISVISGFFALKFSKFPHHPWHTNEHSKYLKGIFAALLISFIGLVIYYLMITSGFIDFTNKIRRMIHVRNNYVSLIAFWFAMQGLGYILIMSLWCFYYSINSFNSLLKHK